MLNRAIQYHQTHFDVTDEGGQFVAATNLGLCYGLLGDFGVATAQHQEALRVAIRLQSFSGQSIAVGNLGLLAMRRDNLVTAKACMEQHLQLVQSLKDNAAETNAWRVLGDLLEGFSHSAARQFRYDFGCDFFGHVASERTGCMQDKVDILINCMVFVRKPLLQ